MGVYIRFRHKADIYGVTSTTGSSGQKKHSWAVQTADAKCDFEDELSFVRSKFTQEAIGDAKIFFAPGTTIDETSRIYNIRDRYGNVIKAGPFEVVQVQKLLGFQGSVHHIEAVIKSAVET